MNFTQIGSLPFNDIDQAIAYSFSHSIPFVPDLPALNSSEFMLNQGVHTYETSKPYKQLALQEFLIKSRQFDTSFNIWKNQLAGPHIMMESLDWSWERSCQVFLRILQDRIKSFTDFNHKKEIWIFIDEPRLSESTQLRRDQLFEILEPFHRSHIFFCIHYCGHKKVEFKGWDKRVGFSYDMKLHPELAHSESSQVLSLIPGIKAGTDVNFKKAIKAITPSCGLWGHGDPEGVLLALKKHSASL